MVTIIKIKLNDAINVILIVAQKKIVGGRSYWKIQTSER